MESLIFLSRKSLQLVDAMEHAETLGLLSAVVRPGNDAAFQPTAAVGDPVGQHWEISEVTPGDIAWEEFEDEARRVVESWRRMS